MARVDCLIASLQKEMRLSGEEGYRMVTCVLEGSCKELTSSNDRSAMRRSTPLISKAWVRQCRVVVTFQLGNLLGERCS